MAIYQKDLANQAATAAGLTKVDSQRFAGALFSAIANALIQRTEIRIPGFGTFKVAHHGAADRRNPKTGEKIRVAAKDAAKFVPGKALKEALNPPPSVPRRKQA